MRTPPMVSLRSLREAHGLTAQQLVDRIAEQGVVVVDQNTIYNVELGRKRASKKLIAAWARALQLQPVDIRQENDLRELLTVTPQVKSA